MTRALLILGALWCSGCATTALQDRQRADVEALVVQLQAEAYPELVGQQVQIDSFEHESAFFQSNFEVLPALWGERRYLIQVNPRLFSLDLPPDALRGVMVHELGHTWDYHRRDRAGLFALLPALLFDEDNQRFERWTDLQTVARGYGPELRTYRLWLKTVLTEEQWQQKLHTYYGPSDLALLIDVRHRCPAVFYRMVSDPPLSTRAILTHCP